MECLCLFKTFCVIICWVQIFQRVGRNWLKVGTKRLSLGTKDPWVRNDWITSAQRSDESGVAIRQKLIQDVVSRMYTLMLIISSKFQQNKQAMNSFMVANLFVLYAWLK